MTTTGRLRTDQRGDLTLELSVIFPALVLFIFLSVQVGLWWHGRQVAEAAAQEAVEAAQVEGATDQDGADAAVWFLTQAGFMTGITIEVTRDGDNVTATVSGDAFDIIPLGSWPITATATGPIEQTIPQPDR